MLFIPTVDEYMPHQLELAYALNHRKTKWHYPQFQNRTNYVHWTRVWQRVGAMKAPPYEEMVARYTEPHRKYHTLEHIRALLHILHSWSIPRVWRNHSALNLAVWYHDAIEDVTQSGAENVEASASLAMNEIVMATHSLSLATEVAELIRATDHSRSKEGFSEAAQLLSDIDLAILGQLPINYGVYARQIREEYARYSDEEYRSGRRQVLQHILDRPIFQTPLFQKALEEKAVRNTESELASL